MRDQWEIVQTAAESWSPQELMSWAFATYRNEIALASGFGVEGMVLIDMATKINPQLKVFTGDTEFLFPETYDLIDRVERRYGIKVERIYSTLTPEEQEKIYGPALWMRSPDQCCNLRKIEPLKKKLAGLRAWITAIRRDQTSARANAAKLGWDDKFQLVKLNPLADWTSSMVWDYVAKHNVPYNTLHDHNYPSIGCTHCTRAVLPGEDPRAGRWSNFQKTECGLHARPAQPVTPLVTLDVPANAGNAAD